MSAPKPLPRWPLLRQIRHRSDGTGDDSKSPATRALRARTRGSQVSRSICPYCAVGCGQLIYHRHGKILSIEGDPESPINQGTLCPKGAACRELLGHERRLTKVRYRPPKSESWQDLDLETAMDMIADRVWSSRARSFETALEQGRALHRTQAIAHISGATLDNEENYLLKKLFTAGLGMVCVSNQARI